MPCNGARPTSIPTLYTVEYPTSNILQHPIWNHDALFRWKIVSPCVSKRPHRFLLCSLAYLNRLSNKSKSGGIALKFMEKPIQFSSVYRFGMVQCFAWKRLTQWVSNWTRIDAGSNAEMAGNDQVPSVFLYLHLKGVAGCLLYCTYFDGSILCNRWEAILMGCCKW